jgi:F-type H+-transporting ATPase subunit epsilon|tara:strand:- start:296 stop:691 length:396 start_codon:yes stop_codon:yes gene_type:complete
MNNFHLDIITPTSTHTYDNVSYLRAPGLDGLLGVQANHANSIIAIDIGEIKITANGKTQYFSTSGGFSDIQTGGVQLLLESFEPSDSIDQERAKQSLIRAEKHIKDKSADLERAQKSILRAKNRLKIFNKK